MIERREQVFLSSTFKDLMVEREAVTKTLLAADCIPAGMELFPASDSQKLDLIKSVIDLCDYYVVIIGGRYGSVDDEEQLSYTELEYDYAVESGKPVMAFLHGEPGSLTADKTELKPKLRKKLQDFRAKAEERVVMYWTGPDDLAGQVALAMMQIRKTHPAAGWVRGDAVMTPEIQRELAELRQQVAELKGRLREEQQHRQDSKDVADLAQGDDVCELYTYVQYFTKEQMDSGEKRTWNNRKEAKGTVPTTWNKLLYAIGPILMDDCPDQGVRSAVNTFSESVVLENSHLIENFGALAGSSVDDESFDDIKVQFRALGLIERSDRKRPVADTGTYWRLTDYGHEALLRLRAIRREDPTSGDLAQEDPGAGKSAATDQEP